MKLNFTTYIAASVLSHLFLFIFLVLTHSFSDARTPTVFNVDIVTPPEINEQKQPPRIKKTTPPLYPRRRPLEKKIRPETMYDDGTGSSKKESRNDITEKSPKKTEQHGTDKKEDRAPTTLSGIQGAVPSGKSGTSSASGMEDNLSSGNEGPSLIPHSDLFDKKTIEKYASKSPPPKKGLSFDTSEFQHRGYMRMLKERIEGIWQYPKEAARQGISGDLYIRFRITREGKLGEIELIRTSGHRALDEAAMKAVKKAEPFWPLPDDWDKDTLEIKGHFIYVFGSTYVL